MAEKKEEQKKPQADKKPVVKKDVTWVIAEGMALTSKKGIIGAGEVVESKFFNGGEDVFKGLCEKGYIVSK